MTEEIIIDGTGCVFYNNGKCNNPNGMACNCNNNAVCYYKELKRLEQENKELKEENERLRDSKFRELDRALEAEDKYHSALEEIKKIAEDVEDASSIRFYRIKKKINEVLK